MRAESLENNIGEKRDEEIWVRWVRRTNQELSIGRCQYTRSDEGLEAEIDGIHGKNDGIKNAKYDNSKDNWEQ